MAKYNFILYAHSSYKMQDVNTDVTEFTSRQNSIAEGKLMGLRIFLRKMPTVDEF